MRCVCEVVFYWSALLAVGFETAVHLNTINENRTNLPNGLTSLYEFSDKVMYLIIIATRSLTVTFFFTCTLRHLPCVFFFWNARRLHPLEVERTEPHRISGFHTGRTLHWII